MDQVALDRLAARASAAGFPSPAHYAIHLEAEVDRLREALETIEALAVDDARIAREALGEAA